MKKRKSLRFVVPLMLLFAFIVIANPDLSGAASGDEKPVTLQLGHNSHAESFTGKALIEWGKQLSDKTGGKLKISIFPQNQMGSNKELSEQTSLGSLDINVQGMNALVDYKVEQGYLTKVPFLFRNTEHAYKWWTSPEGMAIVKKAEAQRVKILGIGLNRMPRQFASKSKPIQVPEDIKGLKVRAGDTATNSALKVLEAVPTNVALNEMYTAISQGMVDVIELPLDYIFDYSIFEVTKHLTLSNHSFDVQWVVINAKKFDSLPASYQKLLVDSMPGLAKDNNVRQEANFKDTLQKLKDKGMNVISTDRSKWEALVPKVIPTLEKTWPSTKGYYEKIMKTK
jgi:tripartite ATP-independent transporter DctP family solute receptor